MKKNSQIYALCFAKDLGVAIEVQGKTLGYGTGKVVITGNLGKAATDTVIICKTLIGEYNKNFYNFDYHIHFKYLSLYKEGASWGLACFILLSKLSGLNMKYNLSTSLAATGEIDLFGNVIPVLYIEEKLNSVIKQGIYSKIIIPKANDISFIKSAVEILQISHIEELLE